jgi:hypothetical protein
VSGSSAGRRRLNFLELTLKLHPARVGLFFVLRQVVGYVSGLRHPTACRFSQGMSSHQRAHLPGHMAGLGVHLSLGLG